MKLYTTGSFCSHYKTGGLGFISEDFNVEGGAVIEHCSSSFVADSWALLNALHEVNNRQTKEKVVVYTSELAVVARYVKELAHLEFTRYRNTPWDKIAQLLRESKATRHPLTSRVRVEYAEKDASIMRLAKRKSKFFLKLARQEAQEHSEPSCHNLPA